MKRNLSAIILSAGLSERMGRFKPLLDVGGKKMIERTIDLFKVNCIDDIVVVTGFNNERLNPVVKENDARPIFNENYRKGMFSSIKRGIEGIKQSAGFFILPVDIPVIRPFSVKKIIQKSVENKNKIIMPYYGDKSGHPPLIPYKFKEDILKTGNQETMRDFFASENKNIVRVELFDSGILMDSDNEEALLKVEKKSEYNEFPDEEECLRIISSKKDDKKLFLHLKKVSEISDKIAESLNLNLDRKLLKAASLLHDISKGDKNHAEAGASYIRNLGFKKVADLVSEHMDIEIDKDKSIQEKEILYFADKIVSNDSFNPDYKKKFDEKMKIYPGAKKEIEKRYENTRLIQSRIEESSGKSIAEIFKKR